jgi:hypothetical protein
MVERGNGLQLLYGNGKVFPILLFRLIATQLIMNYILIIFYKMKG